MIGYSLYLILLLSFFLRLPARVPALGIIRPDLLLTGLVLVFALAEGGQRWREIKGLKATERLLLLMGYVLITLALVEWPGSVIRFGLPDFARVIGFYFFTVVLVNTERRLKLFITVFLICQAVRVLEPAYLHLTTGYWGSMAHAGHGEWLDRLSGGPHDVINPNQLAWVIVSTLPFLYYLGWQGGRLLRMTTLAVCPVFFYALMLTGSRGGLICLLVVIGGIIFMEEGKMRRSVVALAILIPAALVISGKMGDLLQERYISIIDEEARGASTVTGRVEGMKRHFSTVWNRPFIGHGLGTSKEVSANVLTGRAKISHNIYIETLQELGVVGFIIFMSYITALIKGAMQAKVALKGSSLDVLWLTNLVRALQVWIAMNLVYGLGTFGLSSWEWYLFGGIATACLMLAREYALYEMEEEGEGESEPAYQPIYG